MIVCLQFRTSSYPHTDAFTHSSFQLSRYDGLATKRVASWQCFVYSDSCIEETQWFANKIPREPYACLFSEIRLKNEILVCLPQLLFSGVTVATSTRDWRGERSILDEKNRRSYLVMLCNVEIYFALVIKSVLSRSMNPLYLMPVIKMALEISDD